jgi:molecular chaperone DnaK
LNLDGMLKVSAREKATGLQKQITIDNALARFEREERAAARDRLDELWDHSFGDGYVYDESAEEAEAEAIPPAHDGGGTMAPGLAAGAREGQRETVQARALLEKAERLLGQVQPEDRAELERMMGKTRAALAERQWALLEAATNELADALFYLEDA